MAKSGYNTYKGVLVKRRILNELRKNEERVTFFVRDPLCGWAMGIEPTTTGTTIRGSTTELHPPSFVGGELRRWARLYTPNRRMQDKFKFSCDFFCFGKVMQAV